MLNLKRAIASLALLLGLAIAPPLSAQPEFPELSGRIVDAANIIPDAQEAELDAKLAALEAQSERQFVIATLPDLQGYDIADYGYQLGRDWGIGDAERNDGVLLLIAPNERKTRIEVGYGLEPILTDGLTTLIVQKQMLPLFKQGDYVGGINSAADTIIQQLTLPEEEARAVAAKAVPQRSSRSDGPSFDFPTLIFLGIFIFFIIIPMLRGKRGKKYRRGGMGGAVGNIILWEVANAAIRGASGGGSSGGGFGGGFGGGGFGGGGFSGGGGSFGGGGASGGW